MNFSIKELNELIYSLGLTAQKGAMVNKEVNSVLFEKLYAELSRKLEAFDEEVEDEGPEYDSAGYSENDRQPFNSINSSDLEAIEKWLNSGDDYEDWDWDGRILTIFNTDGGVEKFTYQDLVDVKVLREPHSHFVSNEEADEDYRLSLLQDEKRYENTFVSDSARSLKSDRFNGVSQHILDFVEQRGTTTFSEMNEAYRKYTGGSNSLSHIIKALMIPYKNRPTRRYLKKVRHGVYAVDYATQYNWVVNDDRYNYND